MEYKITTSVDMNELWSAVWGSDGIGMDWIRMVRTADGKGIKLWTDEWEPNPQPFRIYDDSEEKWYDVSLDDLVRGYQIAVEQQVKHCGYCLVSDLDDPDACTGDIIIQLAVFGELVYG